MGKGAKYEQVWIYKGEWRRMKENVCVICEYYEKCNKPEREIKCMGYKEKEKEDE